MNKGTKIRTALRALVSFYTALCVYQVAIKELAEMLNIRWLAVGCAILIVVLGLIVDTATTWYNNDFTAEACEGTGWTRQQKAINKGVDLSGVPAEIMETVGILPEGDEGGDE